MPPIAIVEEALTEGRALFAAAGDLRDLFKRGRADVEALSAEAKETVDGLLSKLRAGLDAFRAQSTLIEADGAPKAAEAAPVAAPESAAVAGAEPAAPAPATVGG